MLFVVEQRLIEVHGFGPTLFPPVSPEPASNSSYYLPPRNLTGGPSDLGAKPSTPLVPRYGNTLLAHLIVQGMKLQPCRPSFTDARDAILQSDLILTGGENACTIWKGFAERGLVSHSKH
jgi:extracellular elastinolytic metalloproteinase